MMATNRLVGLYSADILLLRKPHAQRWDSLLAFYDFFLYNTQNITMPAIYNMKKMLYYYDYRKSIKLKNLERYYYYYFQVVIAFVRYRADYRLDRF